MQTDRIKAGKAFNLHEWAKIRLAALKLALTESAVYPMHRDEVKIRKLVKRFKLNPAYGFYLNRPDLFWAD